MLSISANMSSSGLALAGKSSQKRIDTAVERLSTGNRINSAKDDAAGNQISTRLMAEIMGLKRATENANDLQSLLDTASSAINHVKLNALRIRELSLQTSSGTLSSSDRVAINNEVKQHIKSIDTIASNTTWGGRELTDGSFTDVKIQVGPSTSHTLNISVGSISSLELNLSTSVTNTVTNTVTGPSGNPGKNNSTDMSIIANHPTITSNPYFIKFTDDTTAGMIHWYSNGGGTDPTDDPNSKVEILGKEYTIPQGTVANKTSNLQSQLAADGISSTIRNVGGSWGTFLEVSESALSDYISAYGTNSFNFYADPLNVVDGDSNDHDLTTGSGVVQLVSGYGGTKTTTTTTTTITPKSIADVDDALAMIDLVDSALNKLNLEENKLSAFSNRLDNIMSANINTTFNMEKGVGKIKDSDFALESSELARNNLLLKASIQMEVIAKKSGENLTRLLNGDSFVHKKSFLY